MAGSPYAIIRVYFYDGTVFDRVRPLWPSGRVEITDANNSYLREEKLEHEIIEGGWMGPGTFESLWRATKMVRERTLIAEERALAAARLGEKWKGAPAVAGVAGARGLCSWWDLAGANDPARH